jgi:hypothetical protein
MSKAKVLPLNKLKGKEGMQDYVNADAILLELYKRRIDQLVKAKTKRQQLTLLRRR